MKKHSQLSPSLLRELKNLPEATRKRLQNNSHKSWVKRFAAALSEPLPKPNQPPILPEKTQGQAELDDRLRR